MRINTILIPVDFSRNTEIAVSKALQFCQADSDTTTIHLFHVQQISFSRFPQAIVNLFLGYTKEQVNADIKNSSARLEKLKQFIENERKNIRVICRVVFGEPVQEAIIKKAKLVSADLIIIGKKSANSHLYFPNRVIPGKLASITGIPVLTVKPGSLKQEIKTVVIPVGHHFPAGKLKILKALNSKSKPHVRLVMFQNDKDVEARQSLLQTFRWLKAQLPNQVNYEVLEGQKKAKVLMKYCMKVDADMLIVYPGAETRVGNWIKSYISDLMPVWSKTQILAVAQD